MVLGTQRVLSQLIEVGVSRNPNISYFEELASRYDGMTREVDYALPDAAASLLPRDIQRASARVLDLGIGTGLSSEWLAKEGARVTGVDGSWSMLRRCLAKGWVDKILQFDLRTGALPPMVGEFDVAICLGLYEYIENPRRFIGEVASLLSDGGVFVLAIRDFESNPDLRETLHKGFRIDSLAYRDHGLTAIFHTLSETWRYAEESGLKVVAAHEVFAYTSPTQGVRTKNQLLFCRRGTVAGETS